MTVEELITSVLSNIRRDFYEERPREYLRDQTALMKSIARYGYECHQRNWQFDERHILFEITGILRSMREKQAEIQYLPLYLAGAVTRHVGQRAEELSAKAKCVKLNASKILRGVECVQEVTVVRTTSATEQLAGIFGELNRQRAVRKKLNAVKKAKQEILI